MPSIPALPPPPPAAQVIDGRYQNPAQSFRDANGVTWTINLMAQATANGAPDTSTSGVWRMALVGGRIWQGTFAGNWYYKSHATDATWTSGSNPLPAGQAVRIADFQSTMGVGVRFSDPNTNPTALTNALHYGGWRVARADIGDYDSPLMRAPISNGVRIIYSFLNSGYSQSSVTSTLGAAVSANGVASFFGVAGPNESDVGVNNAGQTQADMTNLGAGVAAVPALRGVVPVIAYSVTNYNAGNGYASSVGDLTSRGVHWADVHSYVNSGGVSVQPGSQNPNFATAARGMMAIETPQRRVICSEWGSSGPTQAFTQATRHASGKFDVNTYLDAWSAGMPAIAAFSLMPIDGNGQWQLFDESGNPLNTNAADWIHNFTTIIADTGASARTFTPGALNATVTGAVDATTVAGTAPYTDPKYFIAQRSDGAFVIPIWNEPPVQTGSSPPSDVAPAAVSVTVTFNQAVRSVQRYDYMLGTSVQQSASNLANGTAFPVSLTGYAQILVVTPAVTPTPPPPPRRRRHRQLGLGLGGLIAI